MNAAIDLLRSRGPRGILQPLPDDPDLLAAEPGTGAERALDLDQLQRVFLRLAARLAPKQRAAFVLREIEGLKTAEVAEILGVRESTIRNHLHQARRMMRKWIEKEYPGLVPRSARAPVKDDKDQDEDGS